MTILMAHIENISLPILHVMLIMSNSCFYSLYSLELSISDRNFRMPNTVSVRISIHNAFENEDKSIGRNAQFDYDGVCV